MDTFAKRKDYSFIRALDADPQEEEKRPNKESRQVLSGHYVRVRPTPLGAPVLVHYSRDMADALGLDHSTCTSEHFVKFFSGDFDAVEGFVESWATPYALSIYGEQMYQNCPWGTGNGYGDGRAISVAEVVVNDRWELQLKGAGTTPFSRNADGRAVLRSSVREFLASEFMNNCGVSTTRALSLVASQRDKIMRPWYSNRHKGNVEMPDMSSVPEQFRNMIKAQYLSRFKDPDIMQPEICAITCRVAPSFIRVGHIELFSRRVNGLRAHAKGTSEYKLAKQQLSKLIKHAITREFPEIDVKDWDQNENNSKPILQFLRLVSKNIAKLTADWIRVGYVQGNFNSDNCLVAGRTMDYGPFGFIEKFETHWNMWIGGGQKFGFLNQPDAGAKNFDTFVEAVIPLLENDTEAVQEARELAKSHEFAALLFLRNVWQQKLGLKEWSDDADNDILRPLLKLLIRNPTDYTMFWRQLSYLVDLQALSPKSTLEFQQAAKILSNAFWDVSVLSEDSDSGKMWHSWIFTWLDTLRDQYNADNDRMKEGADQMRKVSPKYVPREWMLVRAYTAANNGDYSLVQELSDLFREPYSEQPDMEETYYVKAPLETFTGIGIGGMSHMS